MKIAIAQLNPIIGDLENNAQNIYESAKIAVEKNARLLLTPELSLCGYPPKDLLLNSSFIQNSWKELQQLAETIPPQLAVLIGTITENSQANIKGEKPLFNSILPVKILYLWMVFLTYFLKYKTG